MHIHVYMCVETRGQSWMPSLISLPLFLRQGLLNLEVSHLTRMSGLRAYGILLFFLPNIGVIGMCLHALISLWVPGI